MNQRTRAVISGIKLGGSLAVLENLMMWIGLRMHRRWVEEAHWVPFQDRAEVGCDVLNAAGNCIEIQWGTVVYMSATVVIPIITLVCFGWLLEHKRYWQAWTTVMMYTFIAVLIVFISDSPGSDGPLWLFARLLYYIPAVPAMGIAVWVMRRVQRKK